MIRNDEKYTVADFEFSINNDSAFQLQLYDLGIVYVSMLFEVPQIRIISHPSVGYTVIDKNSFQNQLSIIRKKYLFHTQTVQTLEKHTRQILMNVNRSLYYRKLPERDLLGLMMAMTSFNWIFKVDQITQMLFEVLPKSLDTRVRRMREPFMKPSVIPHYILWELAKERYSKIRTSKGAVKNFQYLYDCLKTFQTKSNSRKLLNASLEELSSSEGVSASATSIIKAASKVTEVANDRKTILKTIRSATDLSRLEKNTIVSYLSLCGLVVDEEETRHILQMRTQFLLYKKLGKNDLSSLYSLEMDTGWNGMIRNLQL